MAPEYSHGNHSTDSVASELPTLESLLTDDAHLPTGDPKLGNSGSSTQASVGDYMLNSHGSSKLGRTGMFSILHGGGLEFQDLTYTVIKKVKLENMGTVKKEVDLLHGITGNAAQGEVTAIMGPSGAGKSTFLDALAGRISSGALGGNVLVDGQEVTASEMKILSAYVMQDDQLFPVLTVYETLLFAAEVRLPHHMSSADKRAKVLQLIDQLGLTAATNTLIGDEGRRGVSGGERRRVSIGVDIIHGPQLLFLDEPTSGLDSTSAFSVVEKLNGIAAGGSTVLLTIHQPSFRIQQLLSKVIILARGKLIYQGPPSRVEAHLMAFGRELPPGENSIEYLLDVIQEYDRSDVGIEPMVQFNLNGRKPMPDRTPQQRTPRQTLSRSGEQTDIKSIPRSRLVIREAHNYLASVANTPAHYATTPRSITATPRNIGNDYFDPYDGYDHSLNSKDRIPKLAVLFYKNLTENWFDKPTPTVPNVHGRTIGTFGTARTPNNAERRTPARTPGRIPGKQMTPAQTPGHKTPRLKVVTPTESERTVQSADYITEPDGFSEEFIEHRKFANPWIREVRILMWRNYLNVKRTPELFLSRQLVITVMGVVLATLFMKPKHDVEGATQILSFFIFAVSLLFFSSNDAVPTFIQERYIFIRETSHNAYRSSTYVIANFLVYLPFLAFQAMTFVLLTWFGVLRQEGGFRNFFVFWLILYASLITTNSFVMFVSGLVPNYIMGYSAVIAITALFFLTCGFFLDRDSIPGWWKPLHWMSTIKYPYEALVRNQFNNPKDCYHKTSSSPFFAVPGPLVALQPSAVVNGCDVFGPDILKALGISNSHLPVTGAILVLLGWGFFYRVLFYIILRFYSKNVRS